MDHDRSAASRTGRWAGRLVVLVLAAAVAVGTVTVVGQVTGRPLTHAAAVPATAAPTAVPVDGPPPAPPTSAFAGGLPLVGGGSVAEARTVLEPLGATVQTADARRWSRPVQPDWLVCGASETLAGGEVPTGEVTLDAVPAGDPCP